MGKDNIFNHRNLPVILTGFSVIFLSLWLASHVISMILLSIILTLILEPVVCLMQRQGIARVIAIPVLIVGLILLITASILKITAVAPEFTQLAQVLPFILERKLQITCDWLQSFGLPVTPDLLISLIDNIKLVEVFTRFISLLSGILGNFSIIFLLVLFMLYEFPFFSRWLKNTSVKNKHDADLINEIIKNITGYMAVRTLMGLIGGVLVWGTLRIYGLSFAFEWAFLAFILNYVPIVGAVISTIPPIIQCFILRGTADTVSLLVLFVSMTTLMGVMLEPMLIGRKLSMSLTLQMLSLVVWPVLLGSSGAFLAIPLTLTFKKLFRLSFIRR